MCMISQWLREMAAFRSLCKINITKRIFIKTYSTCNKNKKGVVLGAFVDENNNVKLTETAKGFDESTKGVLLENLKISGLKKGSSRLFYKLSPDFDVVAVVGIGKEDAGYNPSEDIDERKQNIRTAAAVGCKSLQELEVSSFCLESLTDAAAAAEGATLGLWLYQEFKNTKKRKKIPEINGYQIEDKEGWDSGLIKAKAQNLVRHLAETPSNHLTPTAFGKIAEKELVEHGVEVCSYDESWAKNKKMGAFLAVSQGSKEPLRFVEMKYLNGNKDDNPIVLVGKGVTFDTGGISIKPASGMEEMRADMSGAACVLGTMKAISQLGLKINLIGLTPLCENMPSGSAIKPGDIVQAMNGKYVQIDNTDAEGRLILADALTYASSLCPKLTVDIATLTGAMRIALGGVLSGVFSTSTPMWEELRKAGSVTGDRVWRFPLVNAYSKSLTEHTSVDLTNIGKGGGGACTAAAFLKEFAPKGDWMHLDIAGVMGPDLKLMGIPYLSGGMSGRPTRTLIQFLTQIACK
nr:cytosol aminopeptidase-like isoform X2 [Halyomorpha halys]